MCIFKVPCSALPQIVVDEEPSTPKTRLYCQEPIGKLPDKRSVICVGRKLIRTTASFGADISDGGLSHSKQCTKQ